jgi:CelD/BcsL family acetyltransferase involved in cellulose biosynthesis
MSTARAQTDQTAEPLAIQTEMLEGRDAFNALEREWNAALAKGPRNEPMLRHEWLKAWIENFAPGATLRVFVARTGKELHVAVPLVESLDRDADTCFVPLTTWSLPVNDHSQRGGILLGARGIEALPAVFESIVAAPGWDRLRLRDLPHGAAEWTIRDRAEAGGLRCGIWTSLESPYRALPELPKPVLVANGGKKQKGAKEPQSRYDLVEASLDSKFRQNLRRRKRRLAEQGETSYVLLDGKDAKALDVALADFFSIEASGWKGRGGTAIAQRPELVGFYTQIARDAAKRGALALGFLTHKGVRIAAHLSIVHNAKHYLVKLGYDESFHEYSPGQQLTSEAMRDSCERGLVEFDFLGPDMDWKRDWEPALRTHSWLTIFRATGKAKLVHEARFVLWPVARAAARALRSVWEERALPATGGAPQARSIGGG